MTKEQQKDKIIKIVEGILDSYSSVNERDICVGVEIDADDIDFATDEIAERICREVFFNDTLTAYNEGYKKGCRSKMAYDYVACAKKYAVKDFVEKLKERLMQDRVTNDNVVIVTEVAINELLKEYE